MYKKIVLGSLLATGLLLITNCKRNDKPTASWGYTGGDNITEKLDKVTHNNYTCRVIQYINKNKDKQDEHFDGTGKARNTNVYTFPEKGTFNACIEEFKKLKKEFGLDGIKATYEWQATRPG